jgi:LysR family glycine cleavage system transcriptional activator
MPRSLPPLNAVRVFEVAARRGSFARAADELNITPAAVSQQVRHLEAQIGTPLFHRRGRGLELTRHGAEYAESLAVALDRMATATERVKTANRPDLLTVSTTPSFASKWLVPRLVDFQNGHPEVDVRLAASNSLVDLVREDVDVAVRYGSGHWPQVSAHLLMRTELFPVCSPRLFEGDRPLREPSDLRHHTMLHLTTDEWPRWLEAAGIPELDSSRGPRFGDAGLLIGAAAAGHGVALGQRVLVADDLAAGRLVAPFRITLPSELAYFVVTPSAEVESPKVKAFVSWLRKAARTAA